MTGKFAARMAGSFCHILRLANTASADQIKAGIDGRAL